MQEKKTIRFCTQMDRTWNIHSEWGNKSKEGKYYTFFIICGCFRFKCSGICVSFGMPLEVWKFVKFHGRKWAFSGGEIESCDFKKGKLTGHNGIGMVKLSWEEGLQIVIWKGIKNTKYFSKISCLKFIIVESLNTFQKCHCNKQ